MRVSDAMIYEQASLNAASARTKMDEASNEVSTGARVVHPGDDAVAAGLIVRYRQDQARQDAVVTETGRATDELTAADTALQGVANLLSEVRQTAMQFANPTYSADQRATAAQDVGSVLDQIIQKLNTEVDGRYIFGGDKDGAPPFDSAGNYVGDTAVRQVEIAPGVLQDASVRADVIAKGVGGGTDVLGTVQALVTALSSNDLAGIQASLAPLDAATNQVALGDSQVGAQMATFEAASTAAQTASDAEKTAASHEADADAIDAASQLALAQQALNASLSASAETFKLTLLDKLG